MPFDLSALDPYARDQRCKPAEALARKREHAFVDFPHLLWIDIEAADGLLADMVARGAGGPRRDWAGFRAGVARYLDQAEPARGGRAPEPSPALAAAAEKAVAASPGRPVAWPALLAAVLDHRPHAIVPLVSDYRLTGAAVPVAARVPAPAGAPADAAAAGGEALRRFGSDLTDQARAGVLGECVGRDAELRRVLAVLGCKEANNPLLLGEAGVGKTRIVEGLAQAIVADRVPARLRGRRVVSLDLGLLVAGTSYRGEFEERLNAVLAEMRRARGGVLLFIDEIHQILGLGRTGGAMDAANLMKPALARGELWCIGATTYEEYRKLDADPAFRRRFQPVDVPELGPEQVEQVLARVAPSLGRHHGVVFTPDALRNVSRMARRYLGESSAPARELALLDAIGAEMALDRGDGPEPDVRPEHVAAAVSARTGVPAARLTRGLRERLEGLAARLGRRVFGQDDALRIVAAGLRRSLTGLSHPDRPRAVFFFAGPSGVGKTELAKALAEELFDSPQALVRLDMSEFQAETARNRLIGSDPGYVGYEEGGRLTEAVRRRPYSLVLLDEFEKAHPSVWRLFLQVFDDGRLTDAKGRTVRFNDTVIVLTSNAGALMLAKLRELGDQLRARPDAAVAVLEEVTRSIPNFTPPLYDRLRAEARRVLGGEREPAAPTETVVREALLATPGFPPELFSRLGPPLVFQPLGREHLEEVLRALVRDLCRRLARARDVALPADPEREKKWFRELSQSGSAYTIGCHAPDQADPVVRVGLGGRAWQALLERGYDPVIGARALRSYFERDVEPAVADQLLAQIEAPALSVQIDDLTSGTEDKADG